MHHLASRFGVARGVAPLVALIVSLGASPSLAAPPPAAASAPFARAVVPPRPLAPLRAGYPEGAVGDALVVLVLVVNADGTVREARIASGDEPFASAASLAALGFLFAPATRDGKAVPAAIRAELRFTAPVPLPSPSAEPAAPGTPSSPGIAAAAPAAPVEVTVRGEVLAPGATSLSRAEVRLLPGAFGDPFRAVELLPGVTPIASGFPYFYVRGAPPGNVGYFLDGIRVPLLYHLGLGPSVVHPALIDRVDLYPGGYPARYGRFAGGVVSGETRPPLTEAHGEGVLRLVDVGGLVEVPFAEGRGAALVAGRYSYTAALLSLIQSQVRLDYWDYQARLSYDLTPHDTLAVFAFGSHDYFGNQSDPKKKDIDTFFDATFHRVDLRYTHRDGPERFVRQSVTLGFDQTQLPRGSFVRDLSLSSRTEVVRRVGGTALLRAGLDATFDRSDTNAVDAFNEDLGKLFHDLLDFAGGAYVDVAFQVTPRFAVTPGLRVDFFGEGSATALGVDPRLAARLEVTRDVRLIEAFGLATQPPSFILPGPGFRRALTGGLQRSLQASAGVEVDLPEDVFASLTLFQSAFFNLTDALGTNFTLSDAVDGFSVKSLGHSLGLELVVKRRLTRKLGGFLSYTLSRATRTLGHTSLPTSFDRTHVANAALSYDFGKGYRAGGRIVFYTGAPRTAYDPTPPPQLRVAERLPPFFRLDVRLEKRWAVGRTGWLSLVLEVLNATATKETIAADCGVDGTCTARTIGPVTLPSLGLEAGF